MADFMDALIKSASGMRVSGAQNDGDQEGQGEPNDVEVRQSGQRIMNLTTNNQLFQGILNLGILNINTIRHALEKEEYQSYVWILRIFLSLLLFWSYRQKRHFRFIFFKKTYYFEMTYIIGKLLISAF